MALSVSCFRTLKCQIIANRFKPAPLERTRDYSRLFIPLVEDKHLNWWGAGWVVLSETLFTRMGFVLFFNKWSLFYTVLSTRKQIFQVSMNVIFGRVKIFEKLCFTVCLCLGNWCFMACVFLVWRHLLCAVFSAFCSLAGLFTSFWIIQTYSPSILKTQGILLQLNIQCNIQK